MRHLLLLISLLSLVTAACSLPPVAIPTTTVTTPTSIAAATTSTPPTINTPEPTITTTPFISDLPILGKAPDISNEVWLNSEPMTLSGLAGKVVLVEFWTYT